MNWKELRVLVTGAGGFIGSHLTEHLVALGAHTRAFIRYSSDGQRGWLSQSPVANKIDFFHGDICDADSVSAAVKDVDVVFHLAALIAIPYSYQAPRAYIRTNVEGTLNILQAAKQYKIQRVVQTSTSETYGSAQYVPIDEKHPLQGQSPYSASKIAADKLAESFHLSFDLPVATIRPFNTYGPRQSARAVIPTIIAQALTSDTIKLGSLTPTRDLNFVADTVDGFIKVAESSQAIGQVINIGTGKEISIGDLANTIIKLIGKDVSVACDEQRLRPENSEVDRLCADNTNAKKFTHWTPKNTLEDGLSQTITWLEQHLAHYRPQDYTV
ncbi:MAG: SDR family NAD(P)-dependent oxidoreductase [Candidatus Latescibacteria bacterium]|jgi:NAD dependent epimerase/dehydratase|nr:SDR family NAD(P)-dependent oxidoreductase [Candidatus Latescibacterota bacterium]MBT4137033.1 SDR family NAD(P)-dependent oxidoreductase [Candidatus Latescibacterota bacterium]MBT5831550.1 SDR family NAD(P)-dependent oxidoreductase [Candidatus Latescibacterota bacterium]